MLSRLDTGKGNTNSKSTGNNKDTGKVPNGNSKASTKPQHGYDISEKATGDFSKTSKRSREE